MTLLNAELKRKAPSILTGTPRNDVCPCKTAIAQEIDI